MQSICYSYQSSSLYFLNTFSKSSQIPNFVKIRPVGTELFHADGETDMTNLTVAILNSANAPKNRILITNRSNRDSNPGHHE